MAAAPITNERQQLVTIKDADALAIDANPRREPSGEDGPTATPEARLGMLAQIGTLQITKAQRRKLDVPAPGKIAAIKPTGEVYIPGVHYRRLLNSVFDAWGLRALSELKLDLRASADDDKGRSIMFREYALVVGGVPVSVVIGEAEYHPNNSRMTWGDAAEAVRTNALTRGCKDLGVYTDPWDPAWSAAWRRKHAVQVWVEGTHKPQWRRVDAEPFWKETGIVQGSPNQDRYGGAKAGQKALPPRRDAVRAERPDRREPEPVDRRDPPAERRAPPAEHRAQVPPSAAKEPRAAGDKELIKAIRVIAKDGVTKGWGVRTTVREYYTDRKDIADAADALMKRETPVEIVSEARAEGARQYRAITELIP